MLDWIKNRIRRVTQQEAGDDWPSVVFLLKDPVRIPSDVAVQMCQAAWGAVAPVKLIGVVRDGHYALQASPLFFAFHSESARYGASGLSLSQIQQQAWDEHNGWMSVDIARKRATDLRKEGSLAEAYKTLMYFAFKHWSPNVLALYFPCEGQTIPNLGDLVQSIRWCRMNGIDLSFLKSAS